MFSTVFLYHLYQMYASVRLANCISYIILYYDNMFVYIITWIMWARVCISQYGQVDIKKWMIVLKITIC